MDKILIAGLGNPGERYEKTRHNIGFMVIDELVKKINSSSNLNIEFSEDKKSNSLLTSFSFSGKKIFLTKPLTFMNESGRAIKYITDYYDIDDIFVIHDDLDLPFSKIRIREKGSSAGHNGLNSIINHLSTNEFKRLKIGIDKPTKEKVISYVTGNFNSEEMKGLPKVIDEASDLVLKEIEK